MSRRANKTAHTITPQSADADNFPCAERTKRPFRVSIFSFCGIDFSYIMEYYINNAKIFQKINEIISNIVRLIDKIHGTEI